MLKKSLIASIVLSLSLISIKLFAFDYQYEAEKKQLNQAAKVPVLKNFQTLMARAKEANTPILIEFSSPWCGYCQALEDNILGPMANDDNYVDRIIIHKVVVDESSEIIGFDGKKVSTIDFAAKHRVGFYPTMVFYKPGGKEVDRIVGLTIMDFAALEIEKVIEKALKQTRSSTAQLF